MTCGSDFLISLVPSVSVGIVNTIYLAEGIVNLNGDLDVSTVGLVDHHAVVLYPSMTEVDAFKRTLSRDFTVDQRHALFTEQGLVHEELTRSLIAVALLGAGCFLIELV